MATNDNDMDFDESPKQDEDKSPIIALETWRNRQYAQCIKLISRRNFQHPEVSEDVHDWVLQNNRLACEIGLATNVKQLRDIESSAVQLIEEMEGVPFSQEIVFLDALVTTNLVAVLLKQWFCCREERNGHIANSAAQRLGIVLKQCLVRMSEYFGCVLSEIEEESTVEMMCLELLNKVKSQGYSNEVLFVVALVTVSSGLYFLLNQMPSTSAALFETFNALLPEQSIFLPNTLQPSTVHFTVLLNDYTSSTEFSHYDVTFSENLLKVFQELNLIALFASKDYVQCLEQLETTQLATTKEDFAYMKAFIYFQQGRIKECLEVVSHIKDSHMTSGTNSRWFNVAACCVYKQNQKHACIQLFNQALNKDGVSLVPLYNMSLVYRALNVYEAELECLKLLATETQNSKSSNAEFGVKDSKSQTDTHVCLKICGEELVHERFSRSDLNEAVVMYLYAKRALELSEFATASTQYEHLIGMLRNGSCDNRCITTGIRIPLMATLLKELAYCLLQSGQFEQCINVCDEFLKATASRHSIDKSIDDQSCLFSSTGEFSQNRPSRSPTNIFAKSGFGLDVSLTEPKNSSTQKRKLNENASNYKETVTSMDRLAVLMLKADALANIDRLVEAMCCLNDVITKCEELMTHEPKVSHASKAARVVNHCSKSVSNSDRNNGLSMLRDAYVNKANILVAMDKLREAVHVSRLAVQLSDHNVEWNGKAKETSNGCKTMNKAANNHMAPYNHTALYNHTLILLKAGRWKDACHAWLPHRGITPDPSSLDITIATQQTKMAEADVKSRTRCFDMLSDIEMIQLNLHLLQVLKQKTSR